MTELPDLRPSRRPASLRDLWDVIRFVRHAVRLEVVEELPDSAPPTRMFRMVGDPAIYVGNGTGNPLRKIPTQPL